MKTRRTFHKKSRGLLITRLIARDGPCCGICAGMLDRSLARQHPMSVTIDHKLPTSHGGSDELENLRLAHLDCNKARGDAYDPEFDQ